MKYFMAYKASFVTLLITILFLTSSLLAASRVIADDTYLNKAQTLINELVREENMEKQALENIFSSLRKNTKVLDLMTNAPERKANWKKYSRIFLGDGRIEKGITFLREHRMLLSRATKQYGVPEKIITAILGVETFYGERQGGHKVVHSLATLAFDHPTRHKFFRSELKHFLRLVHGHNLPALDLGGSYAGAMGYPQFMPSSFANYAVDFDNNGTINIWQNPIDAIGSIANYLAKHGWKKDLPIAYQVQPQNVAAFKKIAKNSLKPSFSSAQLTAIGIDTSAMPTVNDQYSMMVLTGVKPEEYWLGTKNFYVISRYNPSYLYTMAVYRLANLIDP